MEIGITGSTLRIFSNPLFGPALKLKSFSNGTLMSLPTGFCEILASSAALSPSARPGALVNYVSPSAAATTDSLIDNIVFVPLLEVAARGDADRLPVHLLRRSPCLRGERESP
jgi:hypothetical protein